jgi:spermidine/putrescine transport system ATP-binding protein
LIRLAKRFEGAEAVREVSLSIAQGEFFSLLGPSGCGKTTTLRMIAGFEQPTSGEVRLLGQNVVDVPPNRRNVNIVFQHYALFPHLSVFDNVAFSLQVRRVPGAEIRRRVSEALDMVRLPGTERRKPGQLSGGQQQRVALARALINRPAVLLLDEPLGALDQKLRKEMQLELKSLQREVGITFIYVTHDQEEALTMSDRIAVMNQGRALQVDDPRSIYDRPATRFVADFIGTTNFLSGRLRGRRGGMAAVEVDGVGEVLAPLPDEASPSPALTLAVRPERMRLDPAAGSGPANRAEGAETGDAFGAPGVTNRAAGVVSGIVFVGDDTQYFVQLASGERILVREQNSAPPSQAARVQPGQAVTVEWSPASTTILQD